MNQGTTGSLRMVFGKQEIDCGSLPVCPEFRPDAVRRLKADAEHDITVDGPELAAQAIRAGLVDEFLMIVCPVVGGRKRFFPGGVRLELN